MAITEGVDTQQKSDKGKSLDDDVLVYVPKSNGPKMPSTFEDRMAQNKIKAEAHAKKVRSKPVDDIFRDRMKKVGGTTPAEAGAAVVFLKENGEKMPKEKVRERVGIWTEKFLNWVKKQGKEVRSAGGAITGIGDQIEVTPNGHYRFKW